jgi:hypothetical protein
MYIIDMKNETDRSKKGDEMRQTKRTDVHRPSQILPEDYDLVAYTYAGPDPFLQMEAGREKQLFFAHMKSHDGARFFNKENETGGCSICGAFFAYGAIFYHRDSNRYIKIGWICAMKMDSSLDGLAFRNWKERIKSGAEVRAGKDKARRTLEGYGLSAAWEIFNMEREERNAKFEHSWKSLDILLDMTEKLVRYGSWSEKQVAFARKLVDRLENPPAPPKPGTFVGTVKERRFFEATLKVITGYDGFYGYVQVFIFEDADGNNLVWKTTSLPSIVADDKGKVFKFKATVKEHSEYNGRNQTILTRLDNMEEVKPDGPNGSGSPIVELPKSELPKDVAEFQEKVVAAKKERDDAKEAEFKAATKILSGPEPPTGEDFDRALELELHPLRNSSKGTHR